MRPLFNDWLYANDRHRHDDNNDTLTWLLNVQQRRCARPINSCVCRLVGRCSWPVASAPKRNAFRCGKNAIRSPIVPTVPTNSIAVHRLSFSFCLIIFEKNSIPFSFFTCRFPSVQTMKSDFCFDLMMANHRTLITQWLFHSFIRLLIYDAGAC